MTLVMDRGVLPDHRVTHAFVIGCGRFPARADLDRRATVAGARRMVQFLALHADEFIPPVWTIDCLLSDPGAEPGSDKLGVELRDADQRLISSPYTPVDAALLHHVETTGTKWLQRIRNGDQAFFYMSSHGISDGANALGLCEDVLVNPYRRWSQSLNITTLAAGLTTSLGKAARAWVFLDACQEIVPEILGSPTGLPGLHLIQFGVTTSPASCNSIAVAGSKTGGKAWAPTGDEPPYFTQALLEGMDGCCVEAVPDLGWAVTATRLIFDLTRVAEAAFGRRGLETEPLTFFNKPLVGLRRVDRPMIPIALSTEIEGHLAKASIQVVSDDEEAESHGREPGGEEVVWRFRIEAHRKRSYRAHAVMSDGEHAYDPVTFDAEPPGQLVLLRSPR